MSVAIPRLRMFAGPNGSGKSTIKDVIAPQLLGVYINPDEIEKDIRRFDFLDFSAYRIATTAEEVLPFFQQSTLLTQTGFADEVAELRFNDGKLSFHAVPVNAYFASVAADFIRQKLLDVGITFTFETVMSSPDKVAFLKKAQERGFRTYLYFIATEDPTINIARVVNRVKQGGHPVPQDKIIARYYRSLDLLVDAVRYSDRAYIFDNSFHAKLLVAEVTDGIVVETKSYAMPQWFKTALWDKLYPITDEPFL
ncbi:MAG: zeta toxin family protein [Methylococcaceae bacterium]